MTTDSVAKPRKKRRGPGAGRGPESTLTPALIDPSLASANQKNRLQSLVPQIPAPQEPGQTVRSPEKPRRKRGNAQSGQVKHVIVTGVARSGTTALTQLLNSHGRICVGIERFKFLYLRENNYSANLFARERFFDFRASDTNLLPEQRPHWRPAYELMERKWDQAEVIGDKVPDLIPVLGAFMAANPDFRYICTLRNLKDVALSWQARADKPQDSWPNNKGFVQACESWSTQMRILFTLLRERPEVRSNLLLLDYDQMYATGNTTMATIRGFLGVGPSKAFRRTLGLHEEFFQRRQPSEVPAAHAELYKSIDMTCARGLRREARLMAERWTGSPSPRVIRL